MRIPALLAICSTKLHHAKVLQSNNLQLESEPDFLLLLLGLQVHLSVSTKADVM